MKNKIIMFIFLVSISCIAQTENIIISKTPNVLELKEVFSKCNRGELNIYDILSQIVDKSNNSVQGLDEYLFTEYEQEKDTATYYWDTPDGTVAQSGNQEYIKPNKVYAVIALDAIGTKETTEVLLNAAAKHPDAEVRAAAIKSFAYSNYYRAAEGKDKPNKMALGVLFENSDDTTFVESEGKRIGEIAREGIKNWTGEDFGEMQITDTKDVKLQSSNPDLGNYRKQWWALNNEAANWNPETNRYEFKWE